MNELKYFSTFTGAGGFEIGIERAIRLLDIPKGRGQGNEQLQFQEDSVYATSESNERQRATCIGFSEIDKYASQVLKYRYPNTKNYGDISKINWSEVPDFDLLVGGSPCQDLSIAGKRKGLEGARSGLFYEYMRAVREKKPKYFIWENVKGALSSNNGWDFAAVLNEMAEAGYSIQWQVLNAKDFGVPQNRERIFVIGTRGDSQREVFFERRCGKVHNGTDAQRDAYCLNAGGDKHRGTYVEVKEATKQGYAIAEEGDSINLSVPNSTTPRGRVGKGIAKTLDTGMQQHTLAGSRIRRLTPTECERLMSWPDDWTRYGVNEKGETVEISDSQRYKMCGNGVVSNVVENIVSNLLLDKNI